MLVIISDLHLTDGSCGRSISPNAFLLFADRLEELAFNASWRNGLYRPVESVDVLLLGDILDPLHSTLWLEKEIGAPGYVRPWTDPAAPEFAVTLDKITRAILQANADALAVFRRLHQEGIRLPAATRHGLPAKGFWCDKRAPVRFHYMVGNHDWYYRLPGEAFDAIRSQIIAAMGLENAPTPFPYSLEEVPSLQNLVGRYGVYARHGDCYDTLSYDRTRGRNAASLGDVFAVEVLNRFPMEVGRQLGHEIPPAIVTALSELVNVRPILATPLWVSGQLRQYKVSAALQRKIKAIWDELAAHFLQLDVIRQADRRFKMDLVDGFQAVLGLTRRVSFKTLDEIVVWLQRKSGMTSISFTQNALRESAFLERQAQFIVYGHTHHHEIVPLDSIPAMVNPANQIYLNSGTWHTFYDLAVYKPKEQKFVPYQVLTYLAFFRGDERGARRFETWSGAFSD